MEIKTLNEQLFDVYESFVLGHKESLMYYSIRFLKLLMRVLDAEQKYLVAFDGDQLIGVIEVRSNNHISLLFVKAGYQNIGVARKLLSLSLASCRRVNPSLAYIDVHSSPNAVEIYEGLGFTRSGIEQEVNGIRFTPMKLTVT